MNCNFIIVLFEDIYLCGDLDTRSIVTEEETNGRETKEQKYQEKEVKIYFLNLQQRSLLARAIDVTLTKQVQRTRDQGINSEVTDSVPPIWS